MVGDVNLFLSLHDPDEHKPYESGDDDEGESENNVKQDALQGELEIMVADKSFRQKVRRAKRL